MRRQRALSPIVLGADPVAALPAYLNFGKIAKAPPGIRGA